MHNTLLTIATILLEKTVSEKQRSAIRKQIKEVDMLTTQARSEISSQAPRQGSFGLDLSRFLSRSRTFDNKVVKEYSSTWALPTSIA